MLQCVKGIFCDLKIYSISNSAVLDTKELIHKYKFFVEGKFSDFLFLFYFL